MSVQYNRYTDVGSLRVPASHLILSFVAFVFFVCVCVCVFSVVFVGGFCHVFVFMLSLEIKHL